MSIVRLQNIRKVYDTKVAVEGLSLTIEPGTMFGLLGPNGSGKTSSIRMMIGMTVPDSGSVELFGKPFDRSGLAPHRIPARRARALQKDEGHRAAHLSGTAARARRKDRAAALPAVVRAACRLPTRSKRRTEELSKGMQQKIQFIAALLHEPELIIMDEPFSGLDPVNATLLQDTLVELRREGKAILFSTHRMDQVEKLCDAIAIIFPGQTGAGRHGPRGQESLPAQSCADGLLRGPDRIFYRTSRSAGSKELCRYRGESRLSRRTARAGPCWPMRLLQ